MNRISTHVETNSKGTSWKIENQEGIVICRSPQRYRSRKAALKALELFMSTVEAEGGLVHVAISLDRVEKEHAKAMESVREMGSRQGS